MTTSHEAQATAVARRYCVRKNMRRPGFELAETCSLRCARLVCSILVNADSLGEV